MEMPCNPSCFRARTTKTAQSCDPIFTGGERDDQHAMSASIFVKSAPRPTLYTLLIKLVITKPSPLSTLLKVAQSPLLLSYSKNVLDGWVRGGGGDTVDPYTRIHIKIEMTSFFKNGKIPVSPLHPSRLAKVLE